MSDLVEKFTQTLLSFDRISAKQLLLTDNTGMTPFQLIEEVVVPSLEQIGQGWQKGDVALSQVYMSGRICEELVDTFLPPASPDRISQPPVAIASLVDYHLLGKMIICSALRASGIELQDWGRVEVDELIENVKNKGAQILLISALMLPSALRVKEVTDRLRQEELSVKVVVGGAPFRFDTLLWQEVGADGMGGDTKEAIEITHKFIKELA